MPHEAHSLLVLAGFAAGIINTLAGGGSLLTLPALIFAGLDANLANGTNRIGILVQNATAVAGFARGGRPPGRLALLLVAPVVGGALAGARVAVDVPEPLLRKLLAVILVLVLPAAFLPARSATEGRPARLELWHLLVFAAIGFYGGFVQAGVGFLLIAALVPLLGLGLVEANAIKVLLVLAQAVIALPVFVIHHQVDPIPGLLLAAGTMAGAWLGTRLAVLGGARVVRWVLVVAVLLAAAGLAGIPALVTGR